MPDEIKELVALHDRHVAELADLDRLIGHVETILEQLQSQRTTMSETAEATSELMRRLKVTGEGDEWKASAEEGFESWRGQAPHEP